MPHPLSSRLPPATRYLLEHVCLGAPAGDPPPGLADEARRQRISGLYSTTQHADALASLNLVSETVRAVQHLAASGIRALVLKGPLLSKRYYGDFGTRDAGDVDILVDEARAAEADQVLQKAGYARTKPRKPLSARRLKLYFDTQHEFGYTAPDGATSIELHWRYADCRPLTPEPFDALWARSEAVEAGGTELRTLGPADTFLQLAMHGFTDGWSRLKWIADLPRVLAQVPEGAVSEMLRRAEARGFGRVLELALLLAGRGSSQGWANQPLDYIASRLTTDHPRTLGATGRFKHSRAANRVLFTLLQGAALRRAALYCNLIMPADFDALALPDAMTPALPFLAQLHRRLRVAKRRLGQA